eukprot:gene12073-12214_t
MGNSDGKVLFATVLLISLAANGAPVTPNILIPLTYETVDYEILGTVVPIKYGTGAVLTTLVEDLETQQGYWSIAVDQVQLSWLNGSSTIVSGTCSSSSSSCLGLLDSGTAQLVGSIDQVAAVNRAIGAVPSVSQLPFQCNAFVHQVLQATVLAVQGAAPSAAASAAAALCRFLPYTVNVTVDCNSVQQLPNISFILGGEAFPVSSRQYAYQDPSSMKCYSGITSLGSLYPGSWVLGDAFMHNYYTIFDLDPSESSKKNGKPSNANGRSLSRIGIAQLTAAEQAVQVELFDAAVAGKSSAATIPGPINMPQKPLKVAKKIDKNSGNRHGKAPKMKKGKFDIKPKKAPLVAKYKDERVKAPVLAPADQKQKAKAAKAEKTAGS